MDVVIVGYGGAGELHATLLADRPAIRITGIADRAAARRNAASARYPSAAIGARLDELDVHPDIVVVCTPPAYHEEHMRTALVRHRAHVLCEKPAVLDANAGRQLAKIAADAGLVLYPVHNYLHSPAVEHLRTIATTVIGPVLHVAIAISRTKPAHGHLAWRTQPSAGGGILYDHGPHACYLACELAGQPVTSVACTTTTGENGADHAARLSMRLANDATATITLTWHGTTRTNTYELHGARGRARLHNGRLDLTTATTTYGSTTEDHSAGGHTHRTWTKAVHQAFLDQLGRAGSRSQAWNTAVHIADILTAAHTSAATGRPERLTERALGTAGSRTRPGQASDG
ncbi:Gfo/Idh/MocA family protein [Pseudonocardia acaciae]|uniref:Gfo/Idh/MocA family protein n=1 Tax=Pseudonocardia acaciae TaxID=551276 RepID=UPI000684A0B0|nr:Gfo/Idh/MocA family oxidoreductase [Pseudonocardia acaciae]